MSLTSGDKLGPYEILAPVGAGGMGEVWKARDTRLDRVVAIKTAKQEFSERFAREAKAIAALNHPHICALYDVGPNYLVMEFVEGPPLLTKEQPGPLPREKAVEYAGQILDALDAAHRKAITHRDLKPANIMVTRQHGVKLLDFGLARIATGSSDSTVTIPGAVMGTPGYMAPEQWEGKPGDARTDIYCFGCVLYEMLTGKRVAMDRGPVEPVALEGIIRACLEKEPDDRWQSAADVRRALSLAVSTAQTPAVTRTKPIWPWVAVSVLFALGVGAVLGSRFSGSPTSNDVVRFAIYPPEKTVFATSTSGASLNVPFFEISPDGRTLVFLAGAEGEAAVLWRRPLGELSAQPLPGTENAEYPFWSPDGNWIGFFADGKLKKIPAQGGTVEVVVPSMAFLRGAAWGPDNSILFSNDTGNLYRVTAAGGQANAITKLGQNESSHRFPQFLPDGRHFLFAIPGAPSALSVGSTGDTSVKKLPDRISNSAVYVPPGYLLFVEGTTLFGQRFDASSLETSGPPFPIAERAGRASTFKSAISASSTGVIAYAAILAPRGNLTWIDRGGQRLNTVGSEGYYSDFRISPNEKSLAASLLDPKSALMEVWISDLERGSSIRISDGSGILDASPMWSSDGAQLIFRKNRGGMEFRRRSASGGGNDEVVLAAAAGREAGLQSNNSIDTDWSPSGKTILFSATGSNSRNDLWLLPLEGDKRPVKLLGGPSDEMHGNFSPAGQFFAYTSDESGDFQVYVQTLPLSDKKWQVSTRGGYEPRWRADGREIYYLSADRQIMAVEVGPGPSFGVPKRLFPTRVPSGVTSNRTNYVPSRDGKRFLVNMQSENAPPTAITVVMNWEAGLKR